MNLDSINVQELNSQELLDTEGGAIGLLLLCFAAGVAIGACMV